MPDRFKKSLRIGISREGVALLQTSGWIRPRLTFLSETRFATGQSLQVDSFVAPLGSMIANADCSDRLATVVVADEMTRLFMVTPPKNAAVLQDCKAAVEMRFQELFGELSATWRLDADWDARRPFIACAMPDLLLNALQEIAVACRLRLLEVVPQFVAAWNRWHSLFASDDWFGVAHEGRLMLAAMDKQRLCAVRSISLPCGCWHEERWLPEQVAREALRLNLPTPVRIRLCGDVPGDWATHAYGPITCVRLDAECYVAAGVTPSSLVSLAKTGACQ